MTTSKAKNIYSWAALHTFNTLILFVLLNIAILFSYRVLQSFSLR